MKLIRNLDDIDGDVRGGAVTIGNFDGVHRGHARIVEALLRQVRAVGGPAVVLTFDPHPATLLRPESVPALLTWTDRKAGLLAELGVDAVIAYPTDRVLLQQSPETFFQQVVCKMLAARAMVEGPNFRFGRGQAGDVDALERLCDGAGVALEIVAPLEIEGEFVSSSRVRNLIAAGEICPANALLTQPYRVRGLVERGDERGRAIGFPTANLASVDTLTPAEGVYAGRAQTSAGWRACAINVGPSPTFGVSASKIEVHLLDFAGSLYGQMLEVDFFTRLRDIEKFASVEELQAQLQHDVDAARRFYGGAG